MDVSDWFMLAMRWLHGVSAAAWVGGRIFFLAVLHPATTSSPQHATLNRIAGQEFRSLVDTVIWVLLITGVILSNDRLTSGHSSGTYGAVLGLKIALAVWMLYLVWLFGIRSPPQEASLKHRP